MTAISPVLRNKSPYCPHSPSRGPLAACPLPAGCSGLRRVSSRFRVPRGPEAALPELSASHTPWASPRHGPEGGSKLVPRPVLSPPLCFLVSPLRPLRHPASLLSTQAKSSSANQLLQTGTCRGHQPPTAVVSPGRARAVRESALGSRPRVSGQA